MRDLRGTVAIVSGATRKRGLGRAVARALAAAGADIVVTGTDRPPETFPEDERREGWRGLPDIVAECELLGVRAHAVVMDAARSEDAQRLVGETVDRFGRLDILVNNATYARGSDRLPLVELDDDLWRRVLDVNLTGTMLCAKYAARQMIAQGEGGSIVSISSIAALRKPPHAAAYAASKAGMHALSGSLAAELAPHGITVNVVAPGFIDTARIDDLRVPARWQARLRTIPMQRAGTVEEVAAMVRYLCGPDARWLTGQVITIDGGEVR